MAQNRFKLPWWYTVASWIPLTVGLSVAVMMGGVLLGQFAVPSMLGALKWLPAIYNSLEGASRLLGFLFGVMSSGLISWFTTATFTRAWLLFPTAAQACDTCHNLDADYERVINDNETLRARLNTLTATYTSELHKIVNAVNNYFRLFRTTPDTVLPTHQTTYLATSNSPNPPTPNP